MKNPGAAHDRANTGAVMRQSYFPSTDAGLLGWARNMSQRLSADYGAYGIDEPRAADFAALFESYADAYQAANVPGIRSSAATSIKNQAREALKNAARLIVSIVRGQTDVSDAQKIELGITLPAPRRRTIPRPSHAPRLAISDMTGHTVQLRLTDAERQAAGSKPPDVRGALIFIAVGDQPPAPGAEGWRFYAGTSRTKCSVTFPATLPPGTKVWITAAWVNARNQSGPACTAIATHLQFGGPVQFRVSLSQAA